MNVRFWPKAESRRSLTVKIRYPDDQNAAVAPNVTLRQTIDALPEGYSEVSYEGNRYGMTVTRSNAGKSVSLTAKELKGTNFIGFNYYVSSSHEHLRPCEMPEEQARHFLTNQRAIP